VVLIIIIWALAAKCGGSPDPVATGGSGGHSTTTTLKATTTTQAPITLAAKVLPHSLPASHYDASAVTVGGKVTILGGLSSAKSSTNIVWSFDPTTGLTTSTGTLASAVHDTAAGALGANAFVFGGAGPTAPGVYDSIQSIGPTDKKAATVGKLPTPRSSATGVTDSAGPTVYVVGGFDGTNPTNNVLSTIDGVTFTTVAALSTPVRYPAVAVLGNNLWVFGGEWNNAETAVIQRVDLTKHSSSVVAQMPMALSHAMAFVVNNTVFVAGGRTGTSRSNQILRFDPNTFTFTPAGTLVAHVSDAAVAVVGSSAYLFGGLAPVATAQVEQLTPSI
jgi:N-acetylneuraminic acid mutarotase